MRPYSCDDCGASGVKLWREAYEYSPIPLRCGPCACLRSGYTDITLRQDGAHLIYDHWWIYDIGWYVPAIRADGDPPAFWGATSATPEDFERWKALPLLP